MRDTDFKNKVAIVTGAAGGIGREVCEALAKAGAFVEAVDHKPIPKNPYHGRVKYTRLDITDQDSVNKFTATLQSLDILVNSAGTNVRKSFEDITEQDWDSINDVNVKSMFFFIQKTLPLLKKSPYGRVVNIASIQGSIGWTADGNFSLAPYAASKAGVISITKSIALEIADTSITVNSVSPAFVKTDLVAPVLSNPKLMSIVVKNTPKGRAAEINEVVSPVLYLCSEGASYITGHNLVVDGGWLI